MEAEDNKNEYYWKLLQKQVQEQRIERVFDIFRRHGFEPILIKGWAAARNYPQPYLRLSVDIDIAVRPSDYLACQNILRRQTIVGVDLHDGLRHLDSVLWDDLMEHSQIIKLNKTDVRILCPEDHFRILCIHWLTDGGVSKERLWDVVYAIENRPPDFDWERCLNTVSETRREWIFCVVGLAVKYLSFNIENTPFAKMSKNLPKWIIRTVEKEWESKVQLKPLQYCLNNRQEFFQQIQKRLPPNPIQATVEMEGKFNNQPRIFYQCGSLLWRLKPSLERIFKTFWRDRVHKYHKMKGNEQE